MLKRDLEPERRSECFLKEKENGACHLTDPNINSLSERNGPCQCEGGCLEANLCFEQFKGYFFMEHPML